MHPEILGTHQWSFFAGLADLVRAGTIGLKFEHLRKSSISFAATTRVVDVATGSSQLVGWEMGDGSALDDWHAVNADIIIKRGFDDKQFVEYEGVSAKVLPMGLTIGCRSPGSTWLASRSNARLSVMVARRQADLAIRKILWSWAAICRTGKVAATQRHDPIVQESEAFFTGLRNSPGRKKSRHVTFLAKAWDPDGVGPRIRDDLIRITEERADLIRLLRAELGESFVGGFVPSEYAATHFSDCLAQVSTKRPDFLRCVAEGSIGVSTRGISNSNPWKLAEYMALGAAIVSEPLERRLPEPLTEGKNVAVFRTNDECVEQCLKLLDDEALTSRLRAGSAAYWNEHAQPGALLRNRLVEVFSDIDAR